MIVRKINCFREKSSCVLVSVIILTLSDFFSFSTINLIWLLRLGKKYIRFDMFISLEIKQLSRNYHERDTKDIKIVV